MSYITSTEHCVKKEKRKDFLWERGWWNESPQEEVISSVYYMSSCSNGFPFIWKNLVRTSIWDKLWTGWCFLEGAERPAGLQNDSESSQSGLQLKICVTRKLCCILTKLKCKQSSQCVSFLMCKIPHSHTAWLDSTQLTWNSSFLVFHWQRFWIIPGTFLVSPWSGFRGLQIPYQYSKYLWYSLKCWIRYEYWSQCTHVIPPHL